MADKRPRINPELYKKYQKLAIENDTTVEVEINNALMWASKRKKNDTKGTGENSK